MLAQFFTKKRKVFIANKLGEIGTAIIIAFMIGEFVSTKDFHYLKFLIGFGAAIVLYMFAIIVTPKN